MGLIFLLNGIGLVGSATWMGLAFKAGYVASWAIGAAVLFFIGMVVPFLNEYGAVRQGFDRVERDFLSRSGGGAAADGAETFAPVGAARPQVWRGRSLGPRKLLTILLALAGILWAVDLGHYVLVHKPAHAKPERITNI